jgi:hypothetical protein
LPRPDSAAVICTLLPLHAASTAEATVVEFKHTGQSQSWQVPDGVTSIRVDVWPLERAAEAHRAVEGGLRGRVVLRVGSGPAGTGDGDLDSGDLAAAGGNELG